jgi:hypothetical protein
MLATTWEKVFKIEMYIGMHLNKGIHFAVSEEKIKM